MADKNTNINIKVIIDAAESAKTVQQTRQALKDLKSAALQVEEGSDAFVALTRAAGELQDKMGDLSNQTKFFADDMRNLSGLAAIGSGIAGGFNVLQGTMALVAGESEDMQKAMQKVQITMGIVQGLQEVSVLLNKNETAAIFAKAVATKVAATAELIYAAAVGTSTGALKAFRIALLATGIGAIIVGIGLLVANWDKLTAAVGNSTDRLKAENEEQEKANKLKEDAAEKLQRERDIRAEIFRNIKGGITDMENEIDVMKARGDSAEAIYLKEKALIKAKIEELLKVRASETQLSEAQIKEHKDMTTQLEIIDLEYDKKKKTLGEEEKKRQLERNKASQETAAKIALINKDLIDEESKLRDLQIQNIQDTNTKALAESEKKKEDELRANKIAYQADLAEYEKVLSGKAKATARATRGVIYAKSISEIEEKYRRINEDLQRESDKRRLDAQKEFTKQYLTTEEYGRYIDFVKAENTKLEKEILRSGQMLRVTTGVFYDGISHSAQESFLIQLDYMAKLQKQLKGSNIYVTKIDEVTNNLDMANRAFTDGLNKMAESIDKTDLPKAVKDVFSLKEVFLTPEQSSEFNLKIANFYKDKFLIIQEAEKQITEDMRDEAAARTAILESQLKQGVKIPEPDLTQIKGAISELEKGFSVASNGIENLTEDQLKVLNGALSKRYKILQDTSQKSYDEDLYALFKQLDRKRISNEQYLKELEEIKQKNTDTLLEIDVAYGKADQEQLAAATSQRINKIKSQTEKEQQVRQQALDLMVQTTNEAYDAIASKVQETYQQMIDMSNAEYAVRQKNIDREIEDFRNQGKEISIEEQARLDKEAEFQAKKDALEAERAAKEKQLKSEAFEKQRQMDMLAILANTAVAITKQLATTPLPLGAPLIAAIAAQGVIQTAIVSSQQAAFADGGLVIGPGGPKDDMINARLSNGESVINAKSTKMYAPILSQINQAGGGKVIPHFAAGGIVSNVPSSGMDTTRLEDIMLAMANRPIETYVKETSVTRAQNKTIREKKRTSF